MGRMPPQPENALRLVYAPQGRPLQLPLVRMLPLAPKRPIRIFDAVLLAVGLDLRHPSIPHPRLPAIKRPLP